MADFRTQREMMVERQLSRRGIVEQPILDAFRSVPREAFVATTAPSQVYGDHPLPIEAGQTISQPYIVARMIQAAEVERGDDVLEVGAGSGYAAAVLSRIARRVTGIERHPELAALARERMVSLGYDNVSIVEGDGTCGSPEAGPFDVILVAASGSHVPEPLIAQLKPGGRLVMPLGAPADVQLLVKLTKRHDDSMLREELGAVRFVPLIGEQGWSDTGPRP